MIALDPSGIFDYVLQDERDEKKVAKGGRTVWKLRALTDKEMDRATKIGEEVEKGDYSGIFKVIRAGLEGWENLRSPAGDRIEPEFDAATISPLGLQRQVVKEDLLKLIPLLVRVELCMAIIQGNQVTPEELGN